MSLDMKVSAVLDTMTPRESKFLVLKFGLGCRVRTDEEISDMIGFDPTVLRSKKARMERLRQIEAKARAKLRHRARSECVQAMTSAAELISEAKKLGGGSGIEGFDTHVLDFANWIKSI